VLKNAVFLDVTPCGSFKNGVSEERIASIIKVTAFIRNVFRLLVTANVVPS
jgi:hypothetical protein